MVGYVLKFPTDCAVLAQLRISELFKGSELPLHIRFRALDKLQNDFPKSETEISMASPQPLLKKDRKRIPFYSWFVTLQALLFYLR